MTGVQTCALPIFTDLVIDDAAKTYAFTMPDRITTGTGTTLLRGDITVELT